MLLLHDKPLIHRAAGDSSHDDASRNDAKMLLRYIVSDEELKTTAMLFNKQSPIEIVNGDGALYVCQEEWCTIRSNCSHENDKHHICWLGSDDATSCLMMILEASFLCKDGEHHHRCYLVSHLSSSTVVYDGLPYLLEDFFNACNTNAELLEDTTVHLVGGYDDELHKSIDVLEAVLCSLEASSHRFNIGIVCIDSWNTTVGYNELGCSSDSVVPLPIVRGIVLSIETGIIQPAHFIDREPALVQRMRLTNMNSVGLYTPFSWESNELTIAACPLPSIPNQCDLVVNEIITEAMSQCSNSDVPLRKLLHLISTTPYAERSRFITDFLAICRLAIDKAGETLEATCYRMAANGIWLSYTNNDEVPNE